MNEQTNFKVIQIGRRSCIPWRVRVKIWVFSTKRLFSSDEIKKQCVVLESDIFWLNFDFWSPRYL